MSSAMNSSKLECVLVSPEGEVLRCMAQYAQIPSFAGQMQIHAQHTPALLMLTPGETRIVDVQGIAHTYILLGGYAEVTPSTITILAEKIVPQQAWTAEQSASLVHDLDVAYNAANADERDDIATVRAAAACLLHTLPTRGVA
jgi:F-type H+-transporting ATPase subunit epsilon